MQSRKSIHLDKTLKAFTYSVLGVILPFVLSLLPIILLQKYEAIYIFLDQGQFLLFGAGLFTSSIFLFGENKSSISNYIDKFLTNLSFWLLIICSAFYAIVYGLGLLKLQNVSLNINFIRVASVILFMIAMVSVYRSIFIDFLKTYPEVDIKEVSKKGVDDIMEQL